MQPASPDTAQPSSTAQPSDAARTSGPAPTTAEAAALVESAAALLAGVVTTTALHHSARLSAMTGAQVFLKREDLQPVRSYKLRGAYHLIVQLTADERARGVVCASAGNHAQGVAFACRELGVRGRIFVPRTTPRQKRERIAVIGGSAIEVIVTGDTYDDAAAAALAESAGTGAVLVPAFDDLRTVAGQGTIAIEVVAQLAELGLSADVLVVPVGGGGLLAGSSSWLAAAHPGVDVVGVEPVRAASMTLALEQGHPSPLAHLDSFVDGAAVRTVGTVTHHLVEASGARMTTVDEGRLCTEMLALYQSDGIIAEPAGALASAALGDTVHPAPGAVVVCVLSGGNNDVSRYSEILERSLVHRGLKHYFLVDFPQEPGALRRFLDEVLGADDDITLFEYVKRNNRETGPALVGVEIGAPGDLPGLLERLEASALQVERVEPDSAAFRFLL